MAQSQWVSKSVGKKNELIKPRIKITVPRFDNTAIIASYDKTLIGRCMNPAKQDMKVLLFMLPRIWQVKGRVNGTDLGLGRFQLAFDMEEDIFEVLKMEPYHFDYWMISLVRWKSVLDVNYPSKITFWVRALDVPLQFWASSTFMNVGAAIGEVQGEVELLEGRVRVELDGFNPLIFSMEVDFEEGVVLILNLRYEKLFGFCRECNRMTHDSSRCPSLMIVEEEDVGTVSQNYEHGGQATSYKSAVSNGRDNGVGFREAQQGQSKPSKDGGKGKGIAREKFGSFRQDGAYRAYKDKFSRSFGEGSSRGGRFQGYGVPRNNQGRMAVNPGLQTTMNGGEGTKLKSPEKLMLDAFKGLNHLKPMSVNDEGKRSSARKSLQFDEIETAVALAKSLKDTPVTKETEAEDNYDEVLKDNEVYEEDNQHSALDEANLTLEGELLSDSELLEWEDGEVQDGGNEDEMAVEDTVLDAKVVVDHLVEATDGKEEETVKVVKKKSLKPAWFGGNTKKRIVHGILSPRKLKSLKGPAKNGEKGNGDGKKANTKPKEDNM